MSSLVTIGKRKSRKSHKEDFGDKIAEALNGATPGPHVLRIHALVIRLKAIVDGLAQLDATCRARGILRRPGAGMLGPWSVGSPYEIDASDTKLKAFVLEIEEVISGTQKLLLRYRWRPSVRVSSSGEFKRSYMWSADNEDAKWENAAVDWLLSQLSKSFGEVPIARFLLCENCGDWFYAGRDGAKFCRDACRVASHLQTPEGKKVKAKYMRDHRAEEAKCKREIEEAARLEAGEASARIQQSERSRGKVPVGVFERLKARLRELQEQPYGKE